MNDELAAQVREFFAIMDTVEESDMSGKEFHPTTISSCRIMHTMRLDKLLPEMKRLAHESPECAETERTKLRKNVADLLTERDSWVLAGFEKDKQIKELKAENMRLTTDSATPAMEELRERLKGGQDADQAEDTKI
jgi:hypothetical protein